MVVWCSEQASETNMIHTSKTSEDSGLVAERCVRCAVVLGRPSCGGVVCTALQPGAALIVGGGAMLYPLRV